VVKSRLYELILLKMLQSVRNRRLGTHGALMLLRMSQGPFHRRKVIILEAGLISAVIDVTVLRFLLGR
jgi:hypothetical protein